MVMANLLVEVLLGDNFEWWGILLLFQTNISVCCSYEWQLLQLGMLHVQVAHQLTMKYGKEYADMCRRNGFETVNEQVNSGLEKCYRL